jgi:hypothetical protein
MARREIEAHDGMLPKGQALDLGEVGNPGPVEKIAETDFQMERFMEDLLTILVSESTEEGSLPVICPQVNGLNQPIIRGRQQKVKRKYVEALARCRVTKYEQQVMDPMRPENIQMVERTALSYPFAVIEDPHPNGRAWLESILAQR